MITMKIIPQFTLFILLVLSVFKSHSQERGLMLSKYFSPNEYWAGTQNWSVAEDHRGIMYFGNINGVLEYNGATWKLFTLDNLSAARSLATGNDGLIYVGGFNEFGVLLPNEFGQLKYFSFNKYLEPEVSDYGEVWRVNCLNDTVFFVTENYLFYFANGSVSHIKSEQSSKFYLTFIVNDKLYVHQEGWGLGVFNTNKITLVEKGRVLASEKIHSIFPIDNDLLICTRNNGFFKYQNEGGRISIRSLNDFNMKTRSLNDYFISKSYYSGVQLTNGYIAMTSISGDILIIDQQLNVIEVINSETIGIKSPAYGLYQAYNGALWLALDNGIALVEIQSPIRFWDEGRGLSGVIADVARLRDTLYIATGSGVFYTTNPMANDFELSTFHPVNENFEQVWEFLYFQPPSDNWQYPYSLSPDFTLDQKNAILLVATRKGIFQINGCKAKKISGYERVLNMQQSKKDPSKLYLALYNGIALTQYVDGKWVDRGYQFGVSKQINDVAEDSSGNYWLSVDFVGLYRVKPNTLNSHNPIIDTFDINDGLPSVRSIRIFDEHNPPLFYVDMEYYIFNDSTSRFEKRQQNMTEDTQPNEDELMEDALPWYRIGDDILTYFYVAHLTDSVVWFSTSKGITRFKKEFPYNYKYIPPAIITQVALEDSILFHGTNNALSNNLLADTTLWVTTSSSVVNYSGEISYSRNSISFHYSLPFYEGDKPNLFSIKLEGYSKDWTEWTSETKKEFINLPPGRYVFKVKGKNIYRIESEIAEYHFTILPPWYRTIYAYIGFVILLLSLITVIVKFYTYRLIRERDKLEQIVKERTQEILIQKEEIMVQAEHLKDANEWITEKNNELEKQKEELELKKNQLEQSDDTKNKFFRIIAHDLRNPISTAVSTTEYILANYNSFNRETLKDIIEKLNRLSLTTYDLLENLLDWSTSQMGQLKFKLTQVELEYLVSESIDLVKTVIEAKQIEVIVNVPTSLRVFADENMLRTVIRNLISNAVKFSNEKGFIKISSLLKDDFCFLIVEDNGVGISNENLNNLFRIDKDFRTLGTHKERGSGLGLIICKEFMEYNGGSISVHSELGKGSAFTISIKMSNTKVEA
jgi:signal transduction histidine kinase